MSILNAVPVARRDVEAIIRATFPEYRGRKIKVYATEKVSVHDLNWSGGSRSQYRACTLDGRTLGNLDRYNAMHPWSNPAEGATLPTMTGACVVCHTIFCGKDVGLRIAVHPSDLPKLLPAPKQDQAFH